MKRTGDYTVIFPKSAGETNDSEHKVSFVEWGKVQFGSQGGKPCFTFNIRTKSVHGDYYNKNLCSFRFQLKNNKTGKTTNYHAN